MRRTFRQSRLEGCPGSPGCHTEFFQAAARGAAAVLFIGKSIFGAAGPDDFLIIKINPASTVRCLPGFVKTGQ